MGGGSDVYSASTTVVADDLVHGEAGNDYLYGSDLANYYYGDDGVDTISGFGGADEIMAAPAPISSPEAMATTTSTAGRESTSSPAVPGTM